MIKKKINYLLIRYNTYVDPLAIFIVITLSFIFSYLFSIITFLMPNTNIFYIPFIILEKVIIFIISYIFLDVSLYVFAMFIHDRNAPPVAGVGRYIQIR